MLRVRTRVASITGVRVRFEYEIDRPVDGTLVATGHTTLASTDKDGRLIRMPADLRTLLEGRIEPGCAEDGKNAARAAVQGRTVAT